MRAFAEWLRSRVLRSTQLARRLASKRRIYSNICELQEAGALYDRIMAHDPADRRCDYLGEQ